MAMKRPRAPSAEAPGTADAYRARDVHDDPPVAVPGRRFQGTDPQLPVANVIICADGDGRAL